MKKFLILFVSLILFTGCSKTYRDIDTYDDSDNFVLSKLDDKKDYYYFEDLYDGTLSNDIKYDLDVLKINLNSEAAKNVNVEINTLVNQSYKKLKFDEDSIIEGTVVKYSSFINDNYLSVIVMTDYYINGELNNLDFYVYVIDLHDGSLVDTDAILNNFGYDKESFYSKLSEVIVSDDVLFTISNIKNNGYGLYITNDNELGIIYNELDNDDNVRKELVFN